MEAQEQTTKSGSATYSPEDNKLRLYVGRVPREEYLKLRADGWTSTPKQGCDFVAVWTPQRVKTCLEYADLIEDEDQGPAERAADRAERFGEYRDKRTSEATGHADRYDSGPSAHGYQNQARAERAAARHDRIADRAGDAWSKAEYWQRRTAGVIGHALYKSSPGVRMGRIKTLEAELRKHRASLEEWAGKYNAMQKIAAMEDGPEKTAAALDFTGCANLWAEYVHPRAATHPNTYRRENKLSLYSLLSDEKDPITGAEACALFSSRHTASPALEDEWTRHYELRLAYENQMLEAQGGRAAHVEMVVGGFIGLRQIFKVNKSPATGRVVSVLVKGSKIHGWTYKAQDVPGADYSLHQIETERLPANAYRAPTPEELEAFQAAKKAAKDAAPKIDKPPLINPTDTDAERLQALWNERAKAEHCESHSRRYSKDYAAEFVPATVCRITQAVYSANSKGTYGRASTERIEVGGNRVCGYTNRARMGNPVCLLRTTTANDGKQYTPARVIVLTDKPQKPFPAQVWEAAPVAETVTA